MDRGERVAVSDHADRIRRAIEDAASIDQYGLLRVQLKAAVEAVATFEVELQQAQAENERLRGVVDGRRRSLDAANTIHVSGVTTERERQAIDALREAQELTEQLISEHVEELPAHTLSDLGSVRGVCERALVKLGEP